MLICPLSSYDRNSSNDTNCCVPANAHSGHTFASVCRANINRTEMVFIHVLSCTRCATITNVMQFLTSDRKILLCVLHFLNFSACNRPSTWHSVMLRSSDIPWVFVSLLCFFYTSHTARFSGRCSKCNMCLTFFTTFSRIVFLAQEELIEMVM